MFVGFASSIRSRVLFAALLPLLLAVLGVGALLLTRHEQEIERNLMERSISLARQIAILAELPLTTQSRASAKAVADFIESTSGTVGFSLVERSGATIENRGNVGAAALSMLEAKPYGVQVEQQDNLISEVHPVVLFSSPTPTTGGVQGGEQRVGWVALAVSRRDAQRSISRLWWIGGEILLLATLLSLLLVRFAANGIAKPLAKLSSALAACAQDDFSVKLPESERGELRLLAVHYNRMTSALLAARQGLIGEVESATQELAVRTREAEAANSAKSRFLAAASHDLRQPAHALSLYTAALRRGLRQQSTDVQGALLPAIDGMQAASRSLDDLLNAVLDISRFDAGVVAPELQSVAIAPLFKEVMTVFASSAAEKGLQLRFRSPNVVLQTDATLLRRILDNLVSNAIRFSRGGRVLVSLRQRPDHALIQVWDQGLGIAANKLPLIFDEFYQIKRAESDQGGQGGMGLGLAIVKRAASLLGGEISVQSRLGRGTCFSLLLPGAAAPPIEMGPEPKPSLVNARKHVLVLDDDALIRHSMQTLFESVGYSACVAGTVDALLPLAERHKGNIAAILVDYRLQDGFSGIDAARSLQDATSGEVPVFIITGDTSAERLIMLRQSGFSVFHKPLEHEKLLIALAQANVSVATNVHEKHD